MPKHSLKYGTPAHTTRALTHITHKDMKKYSNSKEPSDAFNNHKSKNVLFTHHIVVRRNSNSIVIPSNYGVCIYL